MTEFLVEFYLSRTDTAALHRSVRRARLAAEEQTRRGMPVRYLRSIYVPEDETCFLLYEAGTAKATPGGGARSRELRAGERGSRGYRARRWATRRRAGSGWARARYRVNETGGRSGSPLKWPFQRCCSAVPGARARMRLMLDRPAGPEDRLLDKCRHTITGRAPMTQGHGRARAALAHVLPAIALMTAFLAGPAPMLAGAGAQSGTMAANAVPAGTITANAVPAAKCWPKIKCGDACCALA